MWQARLLKDYLGRLNSTKRRMVDLFSIIHSNKGMFCEQIRDRFYVQELSYTEMKRRALCAASSLSALHKAERIGIQMRNSYEFIVVFWGIILSGNVPVLINSEFDSTVVDGIMADLAITKIFDENSAAALCKSIETKVEPLDFDFEIASDEFILTTTGATGRSKYCFYNGSSISNFINKTPYLLKRIPLIASTKKIKHLMLLPLYHCFGLFAVYFWFGFFGFPFLFIDNILTDLMQNIRNYKVTHIFAVPLFFKTIQREIFKKAKESGQLEEIKAGIEKSFRIQKRLPISRKTLRKKFGAVTENTLGNNICFMISGGASIDADTLKLFNCIGYDLHVGYGMTEVGITSLNLSTDIKSRCTVSIGEIMPGVEYRINDGGVLEILSDTAAFKVVNGDTVIDMTGRFYNTNDRVVKDGKFYKFEARDDEIIAAENGENYNLNMLQSENYGVDFAENYCFIPYKNSVALLVSVFGASAGEVTDIIAKVRTNPVLKQKRVSNILITEQPLPKGLKLINHREVLGLIQNQEIEVCEIGVYRPADISSDGDSLSDRLGRIVARALDLPAGSISDTADLFLEMGCTSFDYYIIMQDIESQFGFSIKRPEGAGGYLELKDVPRTLDQLKNFILENK